MKKYKLYMLIASLCYLVVVSISPVSQGHAIENLNLTQEQQQDQSMLLDLDILGVCISEEAVKELKYGFSTVHIINFAFGECAEEANSLILSLQKINVSNEHIIIIMNTLHKQSVDGFRKMRDSVARKIKRSYINKHSM